MLIKKIASLILAIAFIFSIFQAASLALPNDNELKLLTWAKNNHFILGLSKNKNKKKNSEPDYLTYLSAIPFAENTVHKVWLDQFKETVVAETFDFNMEIELGGFLEKAYLVRPIFKDYKNAKLINASKKVINTDKKPYYCMLTAIYEGMLFQYSITSMQVCPKNNNDIDRYKARALTIAPLK